MRARIGGCVGDKHVQSAGCRAAGEHLMREVGLRSWLPGESCRQVSSGYRGQLEHEAEGQRWQDSGEGPASKGQGQGARAF